MRKTNPKPKRKKQKEYVEGSEAAERFEATMKVIFQVPRAGSKKPKGKD